MGGGFLGKKKKKKKFPKNKDPPGQALLPRGRADFPSPPPISPGLGMGGSERRVRIRWIPD